MTFSRACEVNLSVIYFPWKVSSAVRVPIMGEKGKRCKYDLYVVRCSPRYCEVDGRGHMPLVKSGKAPRPVEAKPGDLPVFV